MKIKTFLEKAKKETNGTRKEIAIWLENKLKSLEGKISEPEKFHLEVIIARLKEN